jgi:hypothetical protein
MQPHLFSERFFFPFPPLKRRPHFQQYLRDSLFLPISLVFSALPRLHGENSPYPSKTAAASSNWK